MNLNLCKEYSFALGKLISNESGKEYSFDMEDDDRFYIYMKPHIIKEKVESLTEVFLLMELIGVTVFCKETKCKKVNFAKTDIKPVDYIVGTIDCKSDAKSVLAENGFIIEGECNYAKRQKQRLEFWVNPKVSVVNEEWDLILNDQFGQELIYIHIPANTFELSTDKKNGLYPRKDKPIYIDLNIVEETMCDRRSGYDFSPYIVKKIKYGKE